MKVSKSRMMVVTALISGLASLGMGSASAADSTLILSGGNGVYNLGPITINGTASSAGVVKYMLGGQVITGCEAVATTTVTPFVAKCAWIPAAAGPAVLTGEFTPLDATLTKATSNTVKVTIGVPVQGVISPIHIYVDTILATGSTGALAPRFNGCAIMNEFLLGQTIVFRVYANNADQGGAVMDSSNTAKAYIEVAGVKDPITLAYGNHSGVAFWTGVLKTGAAPLYSTLGVINYKVTLIAKDSDTMKVLSTKLSAKKNADGTRVLGANGRTVYDRVTYYRTVSVSPALKGATGTWSSNFTQTSQLSLFAAPVAK
ncbi:MAG: hypothetical protein F2768_00295 [Actinobacteria bacterium]|uniref:Unannotated protein n=1 Tax=freshwater metagenome TaxID=449393 RepID=A0A6J7B2H4_9ZZZZ|nr:hypothetical protein [Actinomycetota bacterium]MSX59753.1 hypothetical protein [Actinomycetota bacterium]